MQAPVGRSGIQPAHIRMPISSPEYATIDTGRQKSGFDQFTGCEFHFDDRPRGQCHCTGILTAAPEIQAALT